MTWPILSQHAKTELSAFLTDWLPFRLQHSDVVAIGIAIRDADGEILSAACGEASSGGRHVAEADVFDVASQTKMFTSLAIVMLQQRGDLRLFDEISTHVPEIDSIAAGALADITLYQLLTHQSGLPRDADPGAAGYDLLDAIDLTVKQNGFSPRPSYSNLGYRLLALIVGRVTNGTFEDFVESNICVPLRLQNTFTETPPDDRRAICHSYFFDGSRQPTPPEARVDQQGAVGFWSTPSDMAQLASVHFPSNDTLLTNESKSLFHAIHWGPQARTGSVELALGLESRWMAGTRYLGHSGGGYGSTSATYFDPNAQIAFSVSLNSRDSRVLGEVTECVANALVFFARNATAPCKPELKRFGGRFRGVLGCADILVTSGCIAMLDSLKWQPFLDSRLLEPVDEGTLKVSGEDFNFGNMRLRYSFDIDGSIETVDFGAHRAVPVG